MKRFLLSLSVFISVLSYSQTDSTDLSYSMTDPILLDEMDSLMFAVEDFGEFYLDFDILDTNSFDGVNIEISSTEENEILYKEVFSKAELLSLNSLDSNWHCTLAMGKLEKNINYTIVFVIKDYNGLLSTGISKQFIYETN